MKIQSPYSGLVLLVALLCSATFVIAQRPGGGGGPPGGMGGGGGGGGGVGNSAATTPGGVNLPCDNSSPAMECWVCEMSNATTTSEEDTRRRRYEIRDMPSDEWDTFVFGMQEMKRLSMEEGMATYGPLFKTQEFLVSWHAVASKSLRGDQGHFGSQFLSFHSTFALLAETSILQIAETTERNFSGMPYFWNLDTDASDVLTPEYFGTHPGRGDAYEVIDGPFANWTIKADFDINDYSDYIVNFTDNGYSETGNFFGYLRAAANNLSNNFYVAYPSETDALGEGLPYTGYDYAAVRTCMDTPYDAKTYTVFNFTSCINAWHNSMHPSIGGVAREEFARYDAATMANTEGDLTDTDTSPNAPIFASLHITIDMFLREWASRYPEGADVTWGIPYAESYNYQGQAVVDGANGNDAISSAWPITWADLGWAEFGTDQGEEVVTHAQVYCKLAKENAPYVYVRYSGAPDTAPGLAILESTYVVNRFADGIPPAESNETYITGTIYCDNYFQFYFNGKLIKEDAMTFIPHQAVEVAFTWDGVSDKEYAILCQDFATDTGYEYINSTTPGLGDGALVAAFSDGTRTSADWSTFVVTYGPTEASEADGCSATNLDVCVVEDRGLPIDWFAAGFDFSGWEGATVYTSGEAGWGRTPSWEEGSGCCTSISPLTRENLATNGGCSVNYDLETGEEVVVEGVEESDCIDPRVFFDTGAVYSDAEFLWGSSLTKDNQVLFRFTLPTGPATTTAIPADPTTTTVAPTANPTTMTTTPSPGPQSPTSAVSSFWLSLLSATAATGFSIYFSL